MRKISTSLWSITLALLVSIALTTKVEAGNDTVFSFLTKPYLQNLTDTSVTIMWLTNKSTSSWIAYGETDKLGSSMHHSMYGLIDAGMPVQKATLKGLKPGTVYYYRAFSREIINYGANKVVFGDTIFSELYHFTTSDKDVSQFSFLAFNDVHDRPAFIKDVVSRERNVDFVVYLGDIMGHIESSEKIINSMLSPSAEYFATQIPFIFVRGNHEARGLFARHLIDYIQNPSPQFYYSFSRGPVLFIVLDCGEDKGDGHIEYSGLVDFDAYRTEQSEWLSQVINSREFKKSRFQVVLSHFPVEFGEITADIIHQHGRADIREKFGNQLNNAGADLWLSGHTHKYRIIHPEDQNASFPVVVGGGHTGQPGATFTRVDFTDGKLIVTLKAINGDIIESIEIK